VGGERQKVFGRPRPSTPTTIFLLVSAHPTRTRPSTRGSRTDWYRMKQPVIEVRPSNRSTCSSEVATGVPFNDGPAPAPKGQTLSVAATTAGNVAMTNARFRLRYYFRATTTTAFPKGALSDLSKRPARNGGSRPAGGQGLAKAVSKKGQDHDINGFFAHSNRRRWLTGAQGPWGWPSSLVPTQQMFLVRIPTASDEFWPWDVRG